MVITTTQLHSTKAEFRLETCERFTMVRISDNGLVWLNAFRRSTIPQKQFNSDILLVYTSSNSNAPYMMTSAH